MAVYSFSRLNVFADCPFKYKLRYVDKIKTPEEESIETFLGEKVHKTLQKCYEDVKHSKSNTLDELLAVFKRLWDEDWHSSIFIVHSEYSPSDYYENGIKMLTNYYKRYAPFDSDTTLATEMNVRFPLDNRNKYMISGKIDRVSKTPDGILEVHDYKTSMNLPSQKEIDDNLQLGLYQLGVQSKWPVSQSIHLIWHFLASDTDLVSRRTPENLNNISKQVIGIIDKIESTTEFPPRKSPLCKWCEYPAYCPNEKHALKVSVLPINEYLNEPGVKLVNQFAELREQSRIIEEKMNKIRFALVEYARREAIAVIKGSDFQARVKIAKKLKFPGKNDDGRSELDGLIKESGKWMEVSQLDTNALADAVNNPEWSPEFIEKIMPFGKIEESTMVNLYKLRDEEE